LNDSIGKVKIMNRNRPEQDDEVEKPVPSVYPAEKARQGRIILKQRWQRIVFIAGLTAVVLLALVLPFLWPW
jgi:hypothetical protein